MYTTYYPNDKPYIVEQRVNGIRNGEVKIYDVSGQIINEMEYINGQIDWIEYWQNGLRHNLHDSAYMNWRIDGQIYWFAYYQNGLRHNLHDSAYMNWRIDGQIYWFAYYQNGLRHKLHDPAYMHWYTNLMINLKYYHFGKLIKEYDLSK